MVWRDIRRYVLPLDDWGKLDCFLCGYKAVTVYWGDSCGPHMHLSQRLIGMRLLSGDLWFWPELFVTESLMRRLRECCLSLDTISFAITNYQGSDGLVEIIVWRDHTVSAISMHQYHAMVLVAHNWTSPLLPAPCPATVLPAPCSLLAAAPCRINTFLNRIRKTI